jgi:hypothetical protein
MNHEEVFHPLRRGQCRACKTTDPGTRWSDHTRTHCERCYCAECGRKFLTSSAYLVNREHGVKICRAKERCARRKAMQSPEVTPPLIFAVRRRRKAKAPRLSVRGSVYHGGMLRPSGSREESVNLALHLAAIPAEPLQAGTRRVDIPSARSNGNHATEPVQPSGCGLRGRPGPGCIPRDPPRGCGSPIFVAVRAVRCAASRVSSHDARFEAGHSRTGRTA